MEHLIHRYIRKQTKPEESQRVLEWLRESPKNLEKFSVLKAHYISSGMGMENDENVDHAYEKLRKKQNSKKRARFTKYGSAAAIAILIGLVFHFHQSNESGNMGIQNNMELMVVRNDGKEQKEVLFPDGSTVQLNMDSQIEFPSVFTKEIRSVTIIGEGLFDIVHDSLRPFVVQTQDFNIKVLGTIFNVKSYLNDTQTETTLISGKVEVLREKETPIVLSPSQKAVFNKEEKKIGIEKVVSEDVVAWQKGNLVFKSTPLEQVVLDLERKYDVIIKINSPKLLKYEYTGTFDNLSIKEALQLLVLSSPIEYREDNQEIILDLKK